ncbi:unnamed protein product [Periconia digitata]|uniref:Rhodopsin domain-containing protein n=1 Tax=Periconia digitata TaxID=1303443 RepID=A0A9W4UMX4_9PLEO|nr:unnamed protein product [Periconia digitata]
MPPPTPEQIAHMQEHIDEDRRPLVYGIHSGFMIIGILSVALRFVSRVKIGAKLCKDDWLILAAMVCLIAHATSCMITPSFGVGRHVLLVTNVHGIVAANLAEATSYSTNLMFTKLSILALYYRIFSLTRGWIPTLWAFAVFVIALGITQPLVYIFHCIPIQWSWDENTPNMKCIDFSLAIAVLGTIHIITDWLLLLLPIPVVWSLRLGQRAKISICALFAVGGAVCIISIIRVRKAHELKGVDPTWNFVPVQSLSTVEGSIGILAACMPTWRPLFRFVGQGLSSYFSHNGSRPGGSGFHHSGEHEYAAKKLARSSASSAPAPTRNPSSKGLQHHTQHLGVLPGSPLPSPNSVHWNRHAKRSESNSSGDSVEHMLQGRIHDVREVPHEDVEMGNLHGMGTERSSAEVGYGDKIELNAGDVARPQNTFTGHR